MLHIKLLNIGLHSAFCPREQQLQVVVISYWNGVDVTKDILERQVSPVNMNKVLGLQVCLSFEEKKAIRCLDRPFSSSIRFQARCTYTHTPLNCSAPRVTSSLGINSENCENLYVSCASAQFLLLSQMIRQSQINTLACPSTKFMDPWQSCQIYKNPLHENIELFF